MNEVRQIDHTRGRLCMMQYARMPIAGKGTSVSAAVRKSRLISSAAP